MAWVYILETRSGKYYIWSTTNIEQRLNHHLHGHTPSTKALGAPRLLFRQQYASLKVARRVEIKLKKLKRRDYIEKIIKDGYIRIKPE